MQQNNTSFYQIGSSEFPMFPNLLDVAGAGFSSSVNMNHNHILYITTDMKMMNASVVFS